MTGSKRSRSGRKRVNPRPSKTSARQREEAEIARVDLSLKDIPRYSDRFQLFRLNRRQKAKQILADNDTGKDVPVVEHQIFKAKSFTEIPLSSRTLDGLAAANFTELTGIQKTAIPQALAGRDILAAAPTGSGKTLAFLIPVLEALWRKKWNTMDGLGALILSPTRELGIQIFEVLRSVARQHTISAGLVIGGKDFEGEREKVARMNVLVATPGRLLHHMDHVVEFDCSSLQVLVLDEADRILDLGFSKTLDAILANLPEDRQTMLFSATQTKNVKALARLSLKNPEYVAVSSGLKPNAEEKKNESEEKEPLERLESNVVSIVGTPRGLTQSYAVIPACEKLSVLWSFIKTHLKSKMIVFLATGKQVRFVFETFCKLRPGMSLLHIHGKMKQLKRTDMYDLFCRTKSAVLFATDVASRGLDFPDVEWVVQVDCPDDLETYVHRVGRTARFRAQGRAMLFISEGTEEVFLSRLEAGDVLLRHTKINPQRITDITPKMAAILASNQELKKLAQKAFMFYLKSLYQQSDKEVFNVAKIDYEKLAKSYGLSNVPRVSVKRQSSEYHDKKQKSTTVFGYRLLQQKNARRRTDVDAEVSVDDDLLTVRKDGHGDIAGEIDTVEDQLSLAKNQDGRAKRKKRKLDLMGNLPSANRLIFTEDGQAVRAGDMIDVSSGDEASDTMHDGIGDYAASVSRRLTRAATEDKKVERERVQSLHSRRKARERERLKVVNDRSTHAIISPNSSDAGQSQDAHSEVEDQNELESGPASPNENMPGQMNKRNSVKVDEAKALMILETRNEES
ncbi:unnamed protein product [Agarophyton chilense]